jgi:hypothetical protein
LGRDAQQQVELGAGPAAERRAEQIALAVVAEGPVADVEERLTGPVVQLQVLVREESREAVV